MKQERELIEPSKIFKEDLSLAGITSGGLLKYRPKEVGEKGGIIIRMQSEAIEAFIAEVSKPRAREKPTEIMPTVVKAPDVYTPLEANGYSKDWCDGAPFTYESQYYQPYFGAMPELINHNAQFNLYFLRSVGLSKGVEWKIEGVFSKNTCERFARLWDKALERLYNQILKELSVTITISPGVKVA